MRLALLSVCLVSGIFFGCRRPEPDPVLTKRVAKLERLSETDSQPPDWALETEDQATLALTLRLHGLLESSGGYRRDVEVAHLLAALIHRIQDIPAGNHGLMRFWWFAYEVDSLLPSRAEFRSDQLDACLEALRSYATANRDKVLAARRDFPVLTPYGLSVPELSTTVGSGLLRELRLK